MESIQKIWATTATNNGESHDYSLCVENNQFKIYRDGKAVMFYVDEMKRWISLTGNGMIIEWPTIRDICLMIEKDMK